MPIPKVSIKQIKAARELLGWSQEAIAESSGVSIPTIKRLEATGGELGGRPETGEKITPHSKRPGSNSSRRMAVVQACGSERAQRALRKSHGKSTRSKTKSLPFRRQRSPAHATVRNECRN
jgi:DNA-binding XRE family transcriptional regulator